MIGELCAIEAIVLSILKIWENTKLVSIEKKNGLISGISGTIYTEIFGYLKRREEIYKKRMKFIQIY